MKNHSSLILISSLLLTGCYPCKFLDWNCSQSIADTASYKASIQCEQTQQRLAKEKLGVLYNENIDIYIINKCIVSNGKYQFESDPNYSSY